MLFPLLAADGGCSPPALVLPPTPPNPAVCTDGREGVLRADLLLLDDAPTGDVSAPALEGGSCVASVEPSCTTVAVLRGARVEAPILALARWTEPLGEASTGEAWTRVDIRRWPGARRAVGGKAWWVGGG